MRSGTSSLTLGLNQILGELLGGDGGILKVKGNESDCDERIDWNKLLEGSQLSLLSYKG